MNRKHNHVNIPKFPRPKYFYDFDAGQYSDCNSYITMLNYKYADQKYSYTMRIGRNGVYNLYTEEEFERVMLFFEMMNEQT